MSNAESKGPRTPSAWLPIVTFAEGSFEEVYFRETLAEALCFAAGVAAGSSYYGSGASAYVLPRDEHDMEEEQDAAEVARAREEIAKGPGEAGTYG